MCVMVHQDKENDIEAAGRKWKIRNSTSIFLCLQRMQEKMELRCGCITMMSG